MPGTGPSFLLKGLKRPAVKQTDWPANAIDYFVLAKLENAGIKPSREANRYTLIRRLSFDLRGLPPTLDEVEQFVNDKSPDAYEKLVDRFLSDPAYGERWARKWLDLARYADSKGYGSDPLRLDYLALPRLGHQCVQSEHALRSVHPRTAGRRHAAQRHPRTESSHRLSSQYDDQHRRGHRRRGIPRRRRAVTASTQQSRSGWGSPWVVPNVILTNTIRSRKKNTISSTRYFNQTADNDQPTDAPTLKAPTVGMLNENKRIDTEIAALTPQLQTSTKELERAQQKWEKTLQAKPNWKVLTPLTVNSTSPNTTFQILKDGSIRAKGPAAKENYTVETDIDVPTFKALRLEAVPDKNLPSRGSGRAKDGNFVLSQFKVERFPIKTDDTPVKGQFLRIEHQGNKKQILSLAEVQVFQSKKNIAVQGTATQSSTAYGGPPKRAIDGNTNGDYYATNSTTHTSVEVRPWWELKLKAETPIDSIAIWNRTDSSPQRMDNIKVSLLDAKRNVVWQTIVVKHPAPSRTLTVNHRKQIPFKRAFATFSQKGFAVSKAIDPANKNKVGWGIGPQMTKPQSAFFIPENDPAPAKQKQQTNASTKPLKQRLSITLSHQYKDPQFALGHFRISYTTESKFEPRLKVPDDILAIVDTKLTDRKPEQLKKLAAYYRTISPLLKPVRDQIAKLKSSRPVYPDLPVMQELPTDKQRETRIMIRGSFLSPGDVVKPAVLSAFNAVPEKIPTNRIAVAKWLMSPENPLTARVAVNRFWSELFGSGIVVTEEDFGTQGELPSHPLLLDWLATEFVQNGWDVKALLKTIVMSNTYQQSSKTSPIHIDKDPRNRLLSRGPRFRLEAEMIRDQALVLSGLLNKKIGGPSVYPVQPEGIWRAAFNGQRNWATNKNDDRFRRGLYTFWRRTVPYPSMATFDAPSREICTIRRISTNTPLQAMITLNDPVFIEISQALGLRLFREGGTTPQSRIEYGLKLCLIRPARPEQVKPLLKLYQSELKYYQSHPEEAAKLVENKLNPLPNQYNKAELAAWTVIANVLLNMDGVLTKG